MIYLNYLKVVFLSLLIRILSNPVLIGKEFDNFGRKISVKFLLKGQYRTFIELFCNPVSIVRYFEFPFVLNSIKWPLVNDCLDISSPRLFFLYLLSRYSHIKFDILNPDINDLEITSNYIHTLNLDKRVKLILNDATNIACDKNLFDVATSISVLEHIPDNNDSQALIQMRSVLKKGGKLIITVPCSSSYMEEWRDEDTYGLGNTPMNNKYFFQRFYDKKSLKLGCLTQ